MCNLVLFVKKFGRPGLDVVGLPRWMAMEAQLSLNDVEQELAGSTHISQHPIVYPVIGITDF